MGTQYCTKKDVQLVIKMMSSSAERNGADVDEAINAAIDEASSKARTLLQNSYSITLIDSAVPPIIKDFTAVKAGIILGTQWFPQSEIVEQLKPRAKQYEMDILNGRIVDDAGIPLPQTIYTSTFHPPTLLGDA